MKELRGLFTSGRCQISGHIYITQESDLPVPVAGVITLEVGVMYLFANNLTLTNSLNFPTGGDIYIVGSGRVNVSLTTQTYFLRIENMTGSDNVEILNCRFIDTTTNKKFIISDGVAAGPGGYWTLMDCQVENFGYLGDISTNYQALGFRIYNCGVFGTKLGGFNIPKPGFNIEIKSTGFLPDFSNNVYTMFVLGYSVFITFSLTNAIFQPWSNQYCLKIDNTIVDRVRISNVNNNGYFTKRNFFDPTGQDSTSKYVEVNGCSNISPSQITIETISEIQNITIVSAVNACYIATIASAFSLNAERMSSKTNGESQYDGLLDLRLKIDGSISLEPSLSTNKLLELRYGLLRNQTSVVTFDNATNIILLTGHGLSNDDVITFHDTEGTLPTELSATNIYHIVNKSTDTFQISLTQGGGAIPFTDNGTPTNSIYYVTMLATQTSAKIDATKPQNLAPKAIFNAETDDIIMLCCRNITDTVNIVINSLYIRITQ